MEDIERRVGEERARIVAEYREVLKNSVAFEKKIRNRWRDKNRQKNARIAELEARVAELEKELETSRRDLEENALADRHTKKKQVDRPCGQRSWDSGHRGIGADGQNRRAAVPRPVVRWRVRRALRAGIGTVARLVGSI